MASIVTRGPNQYQVLIRRKGHPSQTKTFEAKREAKAWTNVIESEMVRGALLTELRWSKPHPNGAVGTISMPDYAGNAGGDQEPTRDICQASQHCQRAATGEQLCVEFGYQYAHAPTRGKRKSAKQTNGGT